METGGAEQMVCLRKARRDGIREETKTFGLFREDAQV